MESLLFSVCFFFVVDIFHFYGAFTVLGEIRMHMLGGEENLSKKDY